MLNDPPAGLPESAIAEPAHPLTLSAVTVGSGITVVVIVADPDSAQPLKFTIYTETENVPEDATTMDCVVAPVDHK